MPKVFRYHAGPFRWIAVLLLLCAGRAHGQFMVDLSKVARVAVPDGLYIDSVIASFNDTTRIGIVLRGLDNRSVPAFLSGGISKGIEGTIKNATANEGTLHCTMRVNALDIREASKSTSEECSCALNFELLTKTNGQWMRVFEYAATNSFKAGMNATNKEPANIAVAFAKGLAQYSRQQLAGDLPDPVSVTAPKAGVLIERERLYPVLTVGVPARGFYADFMAFRDQRPDTTVDFTLKPVKADEPRMHLAKLRTTGLGSPPDPLWGVSDGRYLYVSVGDRFLRMERIGNDFKGFYSLEQKRGADMGALAAGLAFGMLGAALASAGSSGKAFIPVRLDMFTGNLLPDGLQDGEAMEKPTTSDHLFLYSHDCLLDTTLSMYVYGGVEATLRRDEYHVLKLVSRPDLVPVEFSVGGGPAARIDIATETMGGITAVYMIHVRKDGLTTLDRLSDEQARLTLKRLDPDKEVK